MLQRDWACQKASDDAKSVRFESKTYSCAHSNNKRAVQVPNYNKGTERTSYFDVKPRFNCDHYIHDVKYNQVDNKAGQELLPFEKVNTRYKTYFNAYTEQPFSTNRNI